MKSCQYTKQTKEGERIYSRYYPIKYYVTCNNSRPWAWCLDSPCLVDKNDPTKADCQCSLVKNKGTYVIVTDTPTSATCQTDIWSSATVKDANEVTDFLKTQSELKPFPVKVQKGE